MELRHPAPPPLRTAAGAAARVALLAGPTVLAFATGGYFENARLIAAIAAWALFAVLVLVAPRPVLPRTTGALLALAGLALLTLWTLLSTAWAPLAGPAGEDVQRAVLYLGVLAAGIVAWRPRAWASAVEPAVALGTLVVVGYGLSGRLLPGIVELHHTVSAGGRLDQPLTYWNAMGALAAIGVVLCARLAGDRTRPDAVRAAASAAGVPLAVGLYLTYSRGALAAVGCGVIVLSLLAPTWAQLRATLLVVEGGVIAAIAASRLDGVASMSGTLSQREADGALMLAVLAVAMAIVAAVQVYGCRKERAGAVRLGPLGLPRWLRVLGVVVAVGLAAFPYAAAVVGERGQENPAFGATAQRFGSVGSNRYAYWRVAVRTVADHPLGGVGAGGFRVEWLRERPFPESVRDAHSLYLETLAELGIVGFALLAAFLAGVALAARRAHRLDPALATGPIAGVVTWAVHAGVDWDWELPALTLVAITLAALLCAREAAQ